MRHLPRFAKKPALTLFAASARNLDFDRLSLRSKPRKRKRLQPSRGRHPPQPDVGLSSIRLRARRALSSLSLTQGSCGVMTTMLRKTTRTRLNDNLFSLARNCLLDVCRKFASRAFGE